MAEDTHGPGDMDAAALLRDLDRPRPLPTDLHQRLTEQLLSAAGDTTQVLALPPEFSSRLSDELQAQAPAATPNGLGDLAPEASGAAATSLDERRRRRAGRPGVLAELRSRWTIGTSAAAAAVLLFAAIAGIVFHPGAANNHAAASSKSAAAGGVSSGAQLYPNSNGLTSTTAAGATGTGAAGSSSGGGTATAAGAANSAGGGSTSGGTGSAPGLAAAAPAAAQPASVTSVTPKQGPVTGGTEVTITGQGLGAVTAVHFGSTAATAVQVVSPTEVKAVAPAHLPGAVDVTVLTPQSTSPTSAADQFTYTAAAP